MGISVALGLLGGRWLDGKAGTKPWLMLAGLLIGVVAGFRGLLRVAKEAQAQAKQDEADATKHDSRNEHDER
jgi:F0F1-type ATP synthase assembly protein I